jgi:hypothetical protein
MGERICALLAFRERHGFIWSHFDRLPKCKSDYFQ